VETIYGKRKRAKSILDRHVCRNAWQIINWNHLINEANCKLSELLVISHRDLDPKNVMWNQDIPYFIDWEAAGYVNPYQELLEVLNYWTNDGKGELDKDKFMTLLNAYRKYMSTFGVDWDCVLNSGYAGMLGWLEYSLKRALGIESVDEEEKVLGAEQVIGTIKELVRYDNQLKILRQWLSE
jgi:thiamine kinase-like enzyme